MKDEKAWQWLNENDLSYRIWNNKYRYNDESFDEWLDRVSGNNEEIKRLIIAKKFLFGGRTLSNRGTNKGSFSNCYSSGYVGDSLENIMSVAHNLAMTYKAQGGQGLSLSKIRPKGSLINGTFQSDGIVPFMEIFNTVTESISQGGSRKGALMMSLDVWHKEIETFIRIKEDQNKITKANLSVELDDAFMESINIDKPIKVSKEYSGQKIDYELNPAHIYDTICNSALKSAEPGVLFTNRLRNYNLMQYVPDYQIETTNPCGEQPLPKNGACNLSSINVSEYVKNPFTEDAFIDFTELAQDIPHIVRAMDDVLEENASNHALQEQREMALKYRNVGIGICGLHDLFIKMGITYGSPKSVVTTEKLMNEIFNMSLAASVELAKERGNFPGYDSRVWDADILKTSLYPEEIEKYRKLGKLRNCSLLSVAPCGSIGTMLNVSSGVEPWFSMHYTRNTKSLEGKDTSFEVWAPVALEATNKNWHPECLVTSNDISWKQHIDIQSAAQKFVDTAISKTINMSRSTTVEDIKQLYQYAWKKGLKGCTIYVDGSRDPILTTTTLEPEKEELHFDHITPKTREDLGEVLSGETYKHKTACGTLYITINKDQNGNVVEIFTNSSKNGTCKANLNGETRMASLALRAGVKVEEVIDQLKGIHCQSCAFARAKGNKIDGTSCPDIISKCLQKSYDTKVRPNIKTSKEEVQEAKSNDSGSSSTSSICPECGKELRHEGGCVVCECGYSKCE